MSTDIVRNRGERLRVALASVLVALTGFGLYLSWGALFDLAHHVGGMAPSRAVVFPIIVDLVTVAAMLLALLVPNPSRKVQAFTWITLALYGAITVAGNASEAVVADPATLALGVWPAVLVNSVPGVSLLVTTHLASINVFKTEAPSTREGASPVRKVRTGAPVKPIRPDRAEALELARKLRFDEGLSLDKIAARTGIPKATLSRRLGSTEREVAA